jgi:hypothetical protein
MSDPLYSRIEADSDSATAIVVPTKSAHANGRGPGGNGDAPSPSGVAAGTGRRDRFSATLARTIVLLDQRVERAQLLALADASAVIAWEFPDLEWRTWLVVDRDPPRIGLQPIAPGVASLTVVMNSTVLHEASCGETSLGMAFIKGRLQIRGMNPLFLAKFVKLVDPLLASYRIALEEVHDSAA